ncbi:RluA family pseudouridine synthase [Thalassospira mesophila]|uniref:Pseudouridine synthase n=1 Tax=Thalassospira mesophila TaxID=1293891 RepID=A0A1Y2L1E0_9PROT|nr:RluA family pseudouridine synthase [Thalassospira mesophila]OSQ38925.1 pseudouridine synthase [Thalassospira mesophila]
MSETKRPQDHLAYTVQTADAGARLDRVLANAWPQESRSRLKALITEGHLQVDSVVQNSVSAKVRAGQRVTLQIPPAEPATPVAQTISLDVLYEDDDLLVINKAAGMVVHPAAGNESGTLVNALLAHCGNSLSGIGGVKRPGIVHRLDKDTSGAMVVAKNDFTHRALSKLFAEDKENIERTYIAVVWGCPVPMEGKIVGNIGRSPRNRKKMAVLVSGGKPALTYYKVVENRPDSLASIVKCKLATGRTHQIRVHMAHIGHSLVCDPVYSRSRSIKHLDPISQKTLQAFDKQALHARTLGFSHPRTGNFISFEAPIPDDLKAVYIALDLSLGSM